LRGCAVNEYFIFQSLAFLSLLLMSYTDLRRGVVDQRKNSFMVGAVLTILLVREGDIFFYLGSLIATIILVFAVKKRIGAGDISALFWLVPGFALFRLTYAGGFLLVFLVAYLLFNILVHPWLKQYYAEAQQKAGKSPAMPIILAAFGVTTWAINSGLL